MDMPGVDMPGMDMGAPHGQGGAPIVVTINPEARVSAELNSPAPATTKCGAPIRLQVKILNQGGITAPLRAHLVDAPAGVAIALDGAPLSGQPEDWRTIRVISKRKSDTDLTIAFSLTNGAGDLADRDRVHWLLRC